MIETHETFIKPRRSYGQGGKMFQSEFKQKKTKETIQSIQQRNSESNRIQTETGKGFKLEADAKQVKARPELYDK